MQATNQKERVDKKGKQKTDKLQAVWAEGNEL